MFIVIADVKIIPEKTVDFKNWFSESNHVVSKFDGFISRRLLEAKDGHHRILVEFESLEKFNQMHQSNEHMQLHSKAITFMDGMPSPNFYTVAAQ